ncbi:MAG: transcriptional repressor [Candidatus Aminicenantes bacterium]|nr:transcriptional repressor [Candidatus Aminicenantes bacterium]
MTESPRAKPGARSEFDDFLRKARLKKTRTRELIFNEIFSRSTIHPDAAAVHKRLRSKGHGVSLATVYRTLKLMVRSGLVSPLDLGEGHSHYEPGTNRPGHGHFICLVCGRVCEFENKELRALLDRVGEAEGFELKKHSLQVFGTCRECRKKKKE